ncbi:flagellar biosynthetic protein FliO [Rhizobium sp. WYJ-E13]|uniref:flagellar biosynthetic protein FliO n=1 Tax=Rhizobium sp. WYJ-E13 TaxID=2849093 RepID=UPI001C1EA26A|nr:flagellar biosynthetic protein FliO [Rhizobium sp. WYJ-E13]QWW69659.1 flagellar biosynthetic protein FliO [Rhizobium sp. WYJ-E13]
MFDDVVGAYGSRFLLAAGGVGIALILLIAILWFLRNRAPSPFVRGGRNRQPRLQVLDAAAVDARRRLVLVRRDNVEHLVMIGGPTDIVIESRILPESEAETAAEFRPQPVVERPVVQEPSLVQPRREPPPAPQPRPVAASVAPPVTASSEPDFETYMPTPTPAPVIAPPAEPIRQRAEPPVAPAVAPPMTAQQMSAQQMPSQPERSAPQMSAPLTAERDGLQRAPQVQPRQSERPAPQPVPDAANAADILDAARQRVLPQQRIEPEVSTPPAQGIPTVSRGAPVATEDGGVQSAAIRRDFQRILDEEITGNVAADRVVPAPNAQQPRPAPQPASSQPGSMPRRDPEMAPITGADAALQKEVARIFGEMSVNRDK